MKHGAFFHRVLTPPGVWAGIALLLVGGLFLTGTTFLGDDHLFRTFARFEPHPLTAFLHDKHGGEYYRPIPMALWWCVERAGQGKEWPFAAVAFFLHGACAWALGGLAGKIAPERHYPGLAALFFFVSQAPIEAALWFSASTDLLATLGILGALYFSFAASRAGRWMAWPLAILAVFSKETALVLPGLLFFAHVIFPQAVANPWRAAAGKAAPIMVLALGYLACRWAVLAGMGGTHDPIAPIFLRGVQVMAGILLTMVGYFPWSQAWALGLGGLLLVGLLAAGRNYRRIALFSGVMLLGATCLLPLAGWVVGARYFYLATASLALLWGKVLLTTPTTVQALVLVGLMGQSAWFGVTRSREIQRYRATVAAAQEAVQVQSQAHGARIFLFRGGVKDLDLAVKLRARSPGDMDNLLLIPDVPASFVRVPSDITAQVGFLFAHPPLPPQGAYRWGKQRVVGLARREEAPDLEETFRRLPDLRVIRLTPDPRGQVTWEDVTD